MSWVEKALSNNFVAGDISGVHQERVATNNEGRSFLQSVRTCGNPEGEVRK